MKRNKHLIAWWIKPTCLPFRVFEMIAQEMATAIPRATTDYMFVDNAAMKMIQEPKFLT